MSTVEIAPTPLPVGSYPVDPAHSSFEFGVRHMKISTVRGRFLDFQATLEGGEQPRIEGSIDTASAATYDETRDGHLKSPDFFDVERYPQATFTGTLVAPDRVEGALTLKRGGRLATRARVEAELTLKRVGRPVPLSAKVNGPDQDPWGNERVGIDLEGEINRQEHGVTWNAPLPGGGALLDDTVKPTADLSFVKGA